MPASNPKSGLRFKSHNFIVFGFIFISFYFKTTQAKFQYTSISSSAILSDSTYKIATHLENAQCPVKFEFKIISSESNLIISSKEQTLTQGTSATIELRIGELDEETYNLTLKATSCDESSEKSIGLQNDLKRTTIFIETDKPIYKGGDTVKFRVLILNRFFQPFPDDEEIDIKIFDSLNNLINFKQTQIVPGEIGLISTSIQLSKEPNLGDWKIQIKLNNGEGDSEEIGFKVDEYVLPKFKIDISLSHSFVTFKNSKVLIGASVIYTFGKPVIGECSITIQKAASYRENLTDLKIVSKTIQLTKGKAFAIFDIMNDLDLEVTNQPVSVNTEFSCKDSVYSNIRNESKIIKVFQWPFKIERIYENSKAEPKLGLPFEIILRISTQDNLPYLPVDEDALIVEYEDKELFRSSIPSSGLIRFEPPLKSEPESTYLFGYSIVVKYKDFETYIYLPSSPIREDSLDHVQLKLVNSSDSDGPKENGRVGISVSATKQFKTLNVIITSRRSVLTSEEVVLTEATKATNIFVNLPPHSFPQIEMIVYFTTELGEIVLDTLEIPVKQDESQSPDIRFKYENGSIVEKCEPGTHVLIKVSSQLPDGILAIKAIDQSILLLKVDNFLDSSRVLNEANKIHKTFFNLFKNRDLKGAESTLKDSNLILLTNMPTFDPAAHRVVIVGHSGLTTTTTTTTTFSTTQIPTTVDPIDPLSLVVKERSNFPETWIWEEHDTLKGTKLTIEKTVPDTITSWIISGYQISSEYGIRISAPEQNKLTAFRPFFVYLNLPYSIVKDEIFALQVIVHNYITTNLTAVVTLHNEDNFFTFIENDTLITSMSKNVEVQESSVTSVTFPISPLKSGTMILKVSATTPLAGDSVKRLLTVKPPGIKHNHNSAVLLNILTDDTARQTIKPFFPEQQVPDADSITISTFGDIMGSTIHNLDNLIRLPYGCGEQNMLNFVPNIVVLNYLTTTRQLKKQLKRKAVQFTEIGYQKQLTFKRPDGSFAIWGAYSNQGSTWLTAFVAKSFISAIKFITIDTKIVDDALKYLIKMQTTDGSFEERGYLYDESLQGGAGSKQGLTAYILLTFVEARAQNIYLNNYDLSIDSIINKGINYLIKEHAGGRLTQVYPLVLTSYLLQLTNHAKKSKIFTKLENLAFVEEGLNQKHWEPISRGTKEVTPASVEMTAYALMTYLIRDGTPKKRIQDSLPIANWLFKQQSSRGGFKSTQDTVIGITALAKFAQELTEGLGDEDGVKVEASWGRSAREKWVTYIGKANRTWIQEYILPSDHSGKEVKFLASGKGTALAQLSWSYYIEASNKSDAFGLKLQVTSPNEGAILSLKITTSYLHEGKSNMAIIEVLVPSGYEFDYEELKALEKLKTSPFKRFELKEKNTMVSFYFDYLDNTLVSFNISLFQAFRVAQHALSYAIVYDYYDTTQKAEASYNVGVDLLCNLCKDDGTCKIQNCK